MASRAVPASAAARAARDEARELRSTLLEREQQARAEIAAGETARQQEADDHDREVALGIGIGLAALFAAAIALAWGWFRATPPVAALSQVDLGRALGMCLGGGLLLAGLTSLGGSIFAKQPAAYSASTQLQEDSKALSQGPDAQRLQDVAAGLDADGDLVGCE